MEWFYSVDGLPVNPAEWHQHLRRCQRRWQAFTVPEMLSQFRISLRRRPETAKARTGRLGERHAARALKREGLRVLARNWRSGRDEIDLVCRDGEVLVFVEVRTRADGALVGGYHSLTTAKKTAMRRAGQAYVKALRNKPAHWRFDLVEVRQIAGGRFQSQRYENLRI
jgi:putative endonuclease